MSQTPVTVVGAGFAGCEAAWALARYGIPVILREMKPQKFSPAHHSPGFAELICSNSFKAQRLESAAGLLKAEMERLGSLCVPCANKVMHLVNNKNYISCLLYLLNKSLHTGFKLTTELCAGHKRRQVQEIYFLIPELVWHVSLFYTLGKSFGDSRFSHTRFAYQARVILLAAI